MKSTWESSKTQTSSLEINNDRCVILNLSRKNQFSSAKTASQSLTSGRTVNPADLSSSLSDRWSFALSVVCPHAKIAARNRATIRTVRWMRASEGWRGALSAACAIVSFSCEIWSISKWSTWEPTRHPSSLGLEIWLSTARKWRMNSWRRKSVWSRQKMKLLSYPKRLRILSRCWVRKRRQKRHFSSRSVSCRLKLTSKMSWSSNYWRRLHWIKMRLEGWNSRLVKRKVKN